MDVSTALAAIIGAILLGAMSPGPSFVLIVSSAVARSRRAAIAAAFGMALSRAHAPSCRLRRRADGLRRFGSP
jgi:threonine/homoserine/homoserine lactone efflux protein